jgi:two-component system, NarL family, response regulator DesR
MGRPINIMIAEDNEDLRSTMVSLLEAEPDIRCVAETDELSQISTLAASTSPQVIILDIELKGRSSLLALAQLRRELPAARFLIYSGHARPEMMRAAMAAGAYEHLLKSGDPYELISAIRRCALSGD